MFKASLQDLSYFKDSLDAISSLVTEGTFVINKEGISFAAMDPATVAMSILKILPTYFISYECEGEHKINLNISNLASILKRAKANETVTLILEEDKLKIKMEGNSKRTFSLPIIVSSEEEQKVPELDFAGSVEIETEVLKDGIKDAGMVSDCVTFILTPESFKMSAKGDLSETELELGKDSPSLISIQINEEGEREIKAKYSIDYLEKILKGAKLSNVCTLKFKTDYPLRVNYTVVDKMQLSFILAPRVDTE